MIFFDYFKKGFCFFGLICFLNSSVFSQIEERGNIDVQLISEYESVRFGESFWIGVRFKMDSGWHIYWKNPGDSGRKTDIKWIVPEGLSHSGTEWPFPKQFLVGSFLSFGYEGEVILLNRVSFSSLDSRFLESNSRVKVSAIVNWLLCTNEICLPPNQNELGLELSILDRAPKKSEWYSLFEDFKKKLPSDISDWESKVLGNDEGLTIKLKAEDANDLGDIYFFPEESVSFLSYSDQKLVWAKDGYEIKIPMKDGEDSKYGRVLNRLKGVLITSRFWSFEEKNQAYLMNHSVERLVGNLIEQEGRFGGLDFWFILLLSLLGGLILNLMPCVFPILSLKIFNLVEISDQSRKKVRIHGLVLTFGILVSFWILAGLLLSLRVAGEEVGWGFQFQSSGFVMVLALFFFIFSLNFFGLFEIGVSFVRLGGISSGFSGYMNSWVVGFVLVIAATPCTAPFMGTAIGLTLAMDGWESMWVFTFLGLGLAIPFLVLAFFPNLVSWLPRSGRWVESFKQLMGFFLLATVIWLIWVLGNQTDVDTVAQFLIILMLVGLIFWIYGRWMGSGSRRVFWFKSVGLTTLSAMTLGLFLGFFDGGEGVEEGLEWEVFSREEVDDLRRKGVPVFINFTAKWCLSCQVNQRFVLDDGEVIEAFKKNGVRTFIADWTKSDEMITKELKVFGRNSIPLYVFYLGLEDVDPIILPEILSKSIILDVFKRLES